MFKRIIAALTAAVCLLSFGGCRSGDTEQTIETATVRFLNFKPEVAAVYEQIAEAYKQETGRTVIIETAANNAYEQTLSAKMATSDAPTIFQINGPRGYANWKRYCADLRDTQLYMHLSDKSLAITDGDGVYGIPYVVEGYGIIYNDAVMRRYFALEDRQTDYQSMDEINNFESLKALTEDIQAHSEQLGIRGAFAVTSLKPGEDWRWQTHLANLPVYHEFRNKNVDLTSNATHTVSFDYADNFRKIFDLYLSNSTVPPSTLGTKIVDESMSEFALGQCAMVQNGNWAWSQISAVEGNTVAKEDIRYLPIYMDFEEEESQGLCIGTENFFCINSKATKEEQQAAADFLFWLFSDDTGKRFVTEQLNFITPFDTFTEEETPNDPLAREVVRYMKNDEYSTIPWQFTLFPSQNFKNDFGSALLRYAQGKASWDDVKNTFITRWKDESAML